MSVEYPHFKIHVAKARDLPLSWFELILSPDKFRKHLETLSKNPDAEPTAFQLIGTFLEQAKCLPGQSAKVSPGTESAMQEERRVALVNSALLLGSLLHWDIALLEKKLSMVVQCGLVSQLCNAYVQEGPLFSKDSDTLMAHVIHSQWVLRFVYRHKHLPNLPSRSGTPAPETNSNSLEQIDNTTKPLVSTALDFLNGLLSTSVPDSFNLPKVGVALSTTGGTVEHLEPPDSGGENEWSRSKEQVLCEISYTLGCYYFTQGDVSRASELFNQCRDYISSLSSPNALLVSPADLRGFLSACKGVRSESGDSVSVGDLAAELELVQLSSWQDVADILVRDFKLRELPLGSRLCLERRGIKVDSNKSTEEPPAKKLKSDQSDQFSLEEGLCAYNALREVMENKGPPMPKFWQLVKESDVFMECVLKLCGKLLASGLNSEERFRIQYFIRTFCIGGSQGGRGWERLSKSLVKELVSDKDQTAYKDLASLTAVPEMSAMETSSSLQTLESGMCQEVTAEATLTAVERLFKTTPTNQHKAIALKWVGVSSGFVPMDSIGDPLTFTKYNILVHRGMTLRQAKSYTSSIEMFSCALKLLSPKTTPLSSSVRQQLEEWLREEILTLELLDAHTTLTHENLEKRLQSGQLAPLIAKSKAYCLDGRHKSSSVTSHLTNALLLNTQHYSFLFSRETQLEPGVIAPRLANCVHCVKEGREMRKPIRDLFDAVLTVFCPPLSTGEGKVESNERQSKLRAGLNVFVENLMDPTSLSLLLATLARVWNLLEKPEFEVLSEYMNHWPTAIGTPGSVDSSHVYRSLNSTITRSLKLEPDNTSWIIMQGHIFCAKQNFGAALHNYLSAGSMVSSYFQDEVPQEVWTPNVYKRLIACCSKLGYHTHALVLSQLLEPIDYEQVFSMIRSNVSALSESLLTCLWDMTIIEYLIYTLSSKGDKHKQKIAIQVAGQPELNSNNSSEVLTRAAQIRRRRFLRTLFEMS